MAYSSVTDVLTVIFKLWFHGQLEPRQAHVRCRQGKVLPTHQPEPVRAPSCPAFPWGLQGHHELLQHWGTAAAGRESPQKGGGAASQTSTLIGLTEIVLKMCEGKNLPA